MRRRGEDFEVSNGGPLFTNVVATSEPARARDLAAAQERGELGARRAESRAVRIDPAWRDGALAQIKHHSERHKQFLAEEVGIAVPVGADPRALGAVFQAAQRAAWIEPNGYAPSKSSNGSPKVLWRSKLFTGGAA